MGVGLILGAATAQAEGAEILVPVLAAPMNKGAIIQPENLTSRTVPSAQVFVSTVQRAAQVLGQQTTRPLAAGEPISTFHLRQPPTINRGQVVEFTFARGVVQLKGSGQALEDGMVGQQIRLLNPATRATLVGVVQSNSQVIVN